jgi:hypothetical protein
MIGGCGARIDKVARGSCFSREPGNLSSCDIDMAKLDDVLSSFDVKTWDDSQLVELKGPGQP